MYLHPQENVYSLNKSCCPSFTVQETVLEQGSGDLNEDTLSVDNDLYIVCDGATSITGEPLSTCTSGGRQAAVITAAAFGRNQGSLEDMAGRANDEIFQAMALSGVDMDDRESLWSTSFAALRFAGDYIEWAQSGDCMIVLVSEDGSHEMITEQPGQDIATLQKWKAVGPDSKGSIHQVLAREIAEVRRGMNRDYGVLNGESEALDFVRYGVEDVNTVTDILLFSDGLCLPSKRPENPVDIGEMVERYRRVGLDGVKKQIRRLQRRDAHCCRYPRFKMFDDISGIALKRR